MEFVLRVPVRVPVDAQLPIRLNDPAMFEPFCVIVPAAIALAPVVDVATKLQLPAIFIGVLELEEDELLPPPQPNKQISSTVPNTRAGIWVTIGSLRTAETEMIIRIDRRIRT